MANWIVRIYKEETEIDNFVIMHKDEHAASREAENDVQSYTESDDWTITELPDLPVGCIFDSHRGIYIGQDVQELALQYGWRKSKAVLDMDDENYHEAWVEAEEYLTDFAPEGHWAGAWEGDFGVYPHEEDELDSYYEEDEENN